MEKVLIATPTPLPAHLIGISTSLEGEHVYGETLNEIEELVTETLQELRKELEANRRLPKQKPPKHDSFLARKQMMSKIE